MDTLTGQCVRIVEGQLVKLVADDLTSHWKATSISSIALNMKDNMSARIAENAAENADYWYAQNR